MSAPSFARPGRTAEAGQKQQDRRDEEFILVWSLFRSFIKCTKIGYQQSYVDINVVTCDKTFYTGWIISCKGEISRTDGKDGCLSNKHGTVQELRSTFGHLKTLIF